MITQQYIERAYTVITLQNQERHKQLDVLQTDRVYADAVNVQLKQPVIQSNWYSIVLSHRVQDIS